MQQKQRPLSSKPVSTIPIYIDQCENQTEYEPKLTQYSKVKGKPKLSQIVPELPQFGIKSNSTALLYSKFIVKGLKEDKLSIVKSALKKKQQITEACTIYKNRPNKSITGGKTAQVHDTICLEDDGFMAKEVIQQRKLNSLLRASSAKVFRKVNNKSILNQGQKQKVLIKNKTQANIHIQSKIRKRPTTAKPSRNAEIRYSQGLGHQEGMQQKNGRSSAGARSRQLPVSSMSKATPIKSLYSAEELNEIVASKIRDNPIIISSSKGIDHIERNIHNVASYCRKNSNSIYLTNTNVQNIIQRRKQRKLTNNQKKQQKKVVNLIDQQNTPKPQQIFIKKDKQKHEKNLRQVEKFLQKQNPSKFDTLTKQMRKKQKKQNIMTNQSYQQLLSKDLDNRHQQIQQINDKSAKACYEDYIQTCQVLEYNISTKLKTQQSNLNNNHTLNIQQCQKIIQTYRSISKETSQEQRIEKINKIKNITKNLKYFSIKSKEQVDKFFCIPFQIVIAEQDYVLIEYNSMVNYIYIILNGSALIQSENYTQNTDIQNIFAQRPKNLQISLYDGEMFGQPARPYQKFYKCRVTTLEQSLLLRINYEQYFKQFYQGKQIQQKLQLLQLAFKMEIMNGTLKQEHLQKISLSLQKRMYPSRSLIFRQGDVFDDLILIKKGKVVCISELILQQDKQKPLDMKQIDKNVRQSVQKYKKMKLKYKEANRFIEQGESFFVSQIPVLNKMRRQNLINYQVLKQDRNKKFYYFMKEQRQFVRGDIVNWQPICQTQSLGQTNNFFYQNIKLASECSVKYSLMSISDQTQIYCLSKVVFQYLPHNIRKILIKKGKDRIKDEIKVQSQKQIIQWKDFKEKLCNQIVKDKRQRGAKARC